MVKLRDYQEEDLGKIRASINAGHRKILCVGGCGYGKGTLLAFINYMALQKGTRMLNLAHRIDLIAGPNAIADRLNKQFGVDLHYCGYLVSNTVRRQYEIPKEAHAGRPIVMGTVQTAKSRKAGAFDILIVDECHRIVTKSYLDTIDEMLEKNPNLVVLGFTATPERSTGKRLGEFFDDMVVMRTHGWLVENNYLVPAKAIYPRTVDTSKVAVRMGDFVEKELEELFNDEVLNSIVDKWEQECSTEKTIVFTINSIQQANVLAEIFRRRGYTAEAITSQTGYYTDPVTGKKTYDPMVRRQLLQAFYDDRYQVLINVNLFTEGISIDNVSCVVLAFATMSITKYIQTASRGARPLWGKSGWLKRDGEFVKPYFTLLDFGSNVDRFGLIEKYGENGFDIEKKEKRKGKAPMKKCPSCDHSMHPTVMTCGNCGFEFEGTEEETTLATDAEWISRDPNMEYMITLSKLPYNRLTVGLRNNKRPHFLLPIAALKGYPEQWVVEMAFGCNYSQTRNKSLSQRADRMDVLRLIKQYTRTKKYWLTYQNCITYAQQQRDKKDHDEQARVLSQTRY